MSTPPWMQQPGSGASPIGQLPGNAEQIRRTARAYEEWAVRLEEAGNAIKVLDTDSWTGPAAEAFRQKYDFEPKRWLESCDRCTEAATALYDYADTLEWAQRELREADAEWREGHASSRAAANLSPDLLVRSAWAQQEQNERIFGMPPKPVSPGDRGAAKRQHALWRRNNAVSQHHDVGATSTSIIEAAADQLPIHRNFLEEIGEFFRGGLDNVEGIINTATDPAGAVQAMGNGAKLWVTDSNAAFRQTVDADGLENSPSRWLGGLVLGGGIGRVGRLGRISTHLDTHIATGHSPRARPFADSQPRISGYHHRPGGVDSGDFKAIWKSEPDRNGVYDAVVVGENVTGNKSYKLSTFFPDNWSPAERNSAIVSAFENRTQIGPGKWAGTYNGMPIQGYVAPGVDVSAATSYDITSAWPVMQK